MDVETLTTYINQLASDNPNKIYLIDPLNEQEITRSELKETILRLGGFFAKHNLSTGDKVGLLLDNSATAVLLFLGAIYHNLVVFPINLVAGEAHIKHTFAHSRVRLILTSREHAKKFSSLLTGHAHVVDLDVSKLPNAIKTQPKNPPTPESPAVLIYTSGTTAQPKGVLLTHKNILAGGRNTAISHRLTEDDCGLCVLPLYHINAEIVSVMATLVSKGRLVILKKFSLQNFWPTLQKYHCTWFSIVPTIINYLLHQKKSIKQYDLSKLRFGRSASAPLSPDVHRAFENLCGIKIIETMGISETAAQILSNPLTQQKHGSVGLAYGNKVEIIDENNRFITTPRQEGELVIKGENVMKGYLNDPENTKKAFWGEWFRSGDLGWRDEEGFFFISGRKKELIIKGGENISPREIDDALYTHNEVVEVATYGIPDENYGEEIAATVYLDPKSTLTPQNLQDICEPLLGQYKTPSVIHISKEPLPKGPSGKIQRRKIAEAALSTRGVK